MDLALFILWIGILAALNERPWRYVVAAVPIWLLWQFELIWLPVALALGGGLPLWMYLLPKLGQPFRARYRQWQQNRAEAAARAKRNAHVPPSFKESLEQLDQLIEECRTEAILERLTPIRELLQTLAPHIDSETLDLKERFILRRIAEEYVVEAVQRQSDLDLLGSDGQHAATARQLLISQLENIENALRETAERISANKLQDLRAYSRFLDGHFAPGGLKLDQPELVPGKDAD